MISLEHDLHITVNSLKISRPDFTGARPSRPMVKAVVFLSIFETLCSYVIISANLNN